VKVSTPFIFGGLDHYFCKDVLELRNFVVGQCLELIGSGATRQGASG